MRLSSAIPAVDATACLFITALRLKHMLNEVLNHFVNVQILFDTFPHSEYLSKCLLVNLQSRPGRHGLPYEAALPGVQPSQYFSRSEVAKPFVAELDRQTVIPAVSGVAHTIRLLRIEEN